MVSHFKDLIVWQKSMDMVVLVYAVTRQFPKDELYGLTNQVRRAVVSVPSNIAEGQSRNSTKEFKNFLSIARGSLAEVETQLLIAQRLQYIHEQDLIPIMALYVEVSKMLNSLMKKL